MKKHQFLLKFILAGTSLLILSPVLNTAFGQWRGSIIGSLGDSIWLHDKGLLIQAAAQVVAHNTLVMFPAVSGALVIAHGLIKEKYPMPVYLTVPAALVFLLHFASFRALDYPLPFSILGSVLVISFIQAWRGGLGRTDIVPNAVISGLASLAVNSLSIVPTLAPYGFNRGDLTWQVVLAGRFLEGEELLAFTGLSFFFLISAIGFGAVELIALYQRELKHSEKINMYELQVQAAQSRVQELRVAQEMHTLVHDLKTPLVTIQGLNSLLQMAAGDERTRDYANRIEKSVDNLNKMISEILYDEVRKETTVDELINYVRSQVPDKSGRVKFSFILAPGLPYLEINVIRFARALINLIENANTATAGSRDGEIEVSVTGNERNEVIFTVKDNGIGLPEEQLKEVWTSGFSSKSSSAGLGLGFVKRVVENHLGHISIESKRGHGTKVTITIPGVKR